MAGDQIDKLKADVTTLAMQAFESGAVSMQLAVVKLLSDQGHAALVVAIADMPLPTPPASFGALANG